MSSWIQKVVRRREVVGGLGLSALLLLFPSLAVAAGPTLKALKLGQKIVYRGYVYEVVKSKGKLVWKQGAKVATATASASATPSASEHQLPLQHRVQQQRRLLRQLQPKHRLQSKRQLQRQMAHLLPTPLRLKRVR